MRPTVAAPRNRKERGSIDVVRLGAGRIDGDLMEAGNDEVDRSSGLDGRRPGQQLVNVRRRRSGRQAVRSAGCRRSPATRQSSPSRWPVVRPSSCACSSSCPRAAVRAPAAPARTAADPMPADANRSRRFIGYLRKGTCILYRDAYRHRRGRGLIDGNRRGGAQPSTSEGKATTALRIRPAAIAPGRGTRWHLRARRIHRRAPLIRRIPGTGERTPVGRRRGLPPEAVCAISGEYLASPRRVRLAHALLSPSKYFTRFGIPLEGESRGETPRTHHGFDRTGVDVGAVPRGGGLGQSPADRTDGTVAVSEPCTGKPGGGVSHGVRAGGVRRSRPRRTTIATRTAWSSGKHLPTPRCRSC